MAEQAYYAQYGIYSSSTAELANQCFLPSCSGADLRTALGLGNVFHISIIVQQNVTRFTRDCTASDCYAATVTMDVPDEAAQVTATINENRWLRVDTNGGSEANSFLCL